MCTIITFISNHLEIDITEMNLVDDQSLSALHFIVIIFNNFLLNVLNYFVCPYLLCHGYYMLNVTFFKIEIPVQI